MGRRTCPSHCMGGRDCAQDGGWHQLGRSRAQEALSWGGEGGWHLNETTCKGGILFACAHPTPRVPTPCLSWCPNRMIHLPYLSLPLPPRVLCPGQGCKYSQKRDPCNRSPATLLPAAPRERGDRGPFRGQAEGGAPGAACWGSPSWSVLLRGAFRVLTVKWGAVWTKHGPVFCSQWGFCVPVSLGCPFPVGKGGVRLLYGDCSTRRDSL